MQDKKEIKTNGEIDSYSDPNVARAGRQDRQTGKSDGREPQLYSYASAPGVPGNEIRPHRESETGRSRCPQPVRLMISGRPTLISVSRSTPTIRAGRSRSKF